jgi:hypothetical protein
MVIDPRTIDKFDTALEEAVSWAERDHRLNLWTVRHDPNIRRVYDLERDTLLNTVNHVAKVFERSSGVQIAHVVAATRAVLYWADTQRDGSDDSESREYLRGLIARARETWAEVQARSTAAETGQSDTDSKVPRNFAIGDEGNHGLFEKAGPYGMKVDLREWKVTRGGGCADFAGKELPWKIFKLLCRNHPSSVPTEEILNTVWGTGSGSRDSLFAAMTAVRAIIKPLCLDVKSVRKVGYKLIELASQKRSPD